MRKLIFSIALTLIYVGQISCTCFAQVIWDAGGDGVSWEDNCNWTGENCGFQPFDGDDALIPMGTFPFPEVTFPEGIANLIVQANTGVDVNGVLTTNLGVTNQGTIDLRGPGAGLQIGPFAPSTTMLQGGGVVILADSSNNPARLSGSAFVPNQTIHAAGNTIHGEGQIVGKWINNGLIRAEETTGDATATLDIGGQMTNHGVIRSSATGAISLSGALTMGAGGQFIADQTPVVLVGTCSVTGGTLEAINGAKFIHPSAQMTLSSVTLNTDLDVIVNNGGLTGAGTGFTNNGTITVDNQGIANGELFMSSGTTLDGSGQVILNRANDFTRLTGSFTHGENHTIRGAGRIQADIVNHGAIVAEPRNGNLLRVVSSELNNFGTIQADAGATLRIEQESVITQEPLAQVSALQGSNVDLLNNSSIIGGKLQTEGTGLIVVPSSNANIFTNVMNDGNFHVLSNAVTRINGSTFTNEGVVTVNPLGVAGSLTRLEFGGNVLLQGSGMVLLNQSGNGATITNAVGNEIITQAAEHTILGRGLINNGFGSGRFVNHGRLEGNSAAEPLEIFSRLSGDGVLKDVAIGGGFIQIQHILGEIGSTTVVPVEGSYNFGRNTSLLVDLAGTSPGTGHDQLNSTGPISLSSIATRLEVSIALGFVPSAGDMFTVITTSDAATGTIGTHVLPTDIPFFKLTWKPVLYTGQEVILEVLSVSPVLLGDVNGDGAVDLLDIAPFVALLTAGGYDAAADLNGDSFVNLSDIAPFVELLSGG